MAAEVAIGTSKEQREHLVESPEDSLVKDSECSLKEGALEHAANWAKEVAKLFDFNIGTQLVL